MIRCSTPPTANTGRERKPWNKRERSLIDKLQDETARRLAAMRRVIPDPKADEEALRSMEAAFKESRFVQKVGDIYNLKPDTVDKVGSFLAAKLGWKRRNPFNASTDYSPAGEVREGLLESRRVAQRMLDEAGQMRAAQGLKNFRQKLMRELKALKLDPSLSQEIMYDAMEIGQIPKMRVALGQSAAVEQFQNARYMDWVNRMEEYGFTNKQIDDITDGAAQVSAAFDEVRTVADAVGYHIPTLEGLGYFPRIATRDFKMRLRDINTEENLGKQFRTGNTLTSDWDKMRKTNWYIPNTDHPLVADLLGIKEEELLEYLTPGNEGDWLSFLHNSLSTEQLDDLVDSGLFSKLPMSGREVFEYMVKQYELPYKHINDMFLTNPKVAIEAYANELKEAVANHAMIRTVVKDGMKAGWAVTAAQLEGIPAHLRKNFKALGSLDVGKWYEGDELKTMGNIFVHRTVADQWRSILSVSSSPVQLSNFALGWRYFTSNLNKSVLLSQNVLYAGRIFMGNVIQAHAAGADLTKLLPAMMDIGRAHSIGFEAFDNTKPYAKLDGKWFTKQELFREFRLHRGDDIAPMTPGIRSSGLQFGALDPRNIPKALGLMYNYTMAHGGENAVARGAEYAGSLAQNILDEAFAPFAMLGNYLDQVGKWMSVMSLVDKGENALPSLGQIATGWSAKKFGTKKELFRHIDDYFFTYDDIGETTAFVGKFIRPFASYAMSNPPAQLRNALRHPQKYLAYHRLLQLWNYDETDGELPEGGLNSYDHENYPVVLNMDKTTKEVMALMPNNYDPITDSFTFFRESGESVARAAGFYVGTSQEQIDKALGKETLASWFQKTMEQSYYAKPAELITGIDSFTGKKIADEDKFNTYLGVPMSAQAEAFLSFFPPIDSFNRWNPGNIFGRKGKEDRFGNVTREPQPSIFGYSRTDNDNKLEAYESAGAGERFLLTLGANIKVIDYAKNMNYTLSDLNATHRDLVSGIRSEQLALANTDKEGSEYKARLRDLEHKMYVRDQLMYEVARVRVWMAKNGIPERDAVDELKKRKIAASQLPLPGAKFQRQLIIDGLKERDATFGSDNTKLIRELEDANK